MNPRVDCRSRRQFLVSSVAGAVGLAAMPRGKLLADEPLPPQHAKVCILVWLNGGPSHLDTFDPKPGAETGGPFEAIDTAVPGIRLCQHLPELAKQAARLAVLRSLTSKEADHGRANYYVHTGNTQQPVTQFPTLGSVVAKNRPDDAADLPSFVTIGNVGFENSAGFFGLDFNPYTVDDLNAPVPNAVANEAVDPQRRSRRLAALERFNGEFAGRVAQDVAGGFSSSIAKALRLMNGSGIKAFNLDEESAETRGAYRADGDEAGFGKACLVARRLVERGVKFVEVSLDGWDTHVDNFNAVAGLCGQLDAPLAALVADLAERGLLDETLVLCLGEFGRTPTINGNNGRDHWSEAFSALLAGGGIRGGQVVGATDERGEQVAERPVTVPDLYATLLDRFGILPDRQYRTPEGRPIRLVSTGKIVSELL